MEMKRHLTTPSNTTQDPALLWRWENQIKMSIKIRQIDLNTPPRWCGVVSDQRVKVFTADVMWWSARALPGVSSLSLSLYLADGTPLSVPRRESRGQH